MKLLAVLTLCLSTTMAGYTEILKEIEEKTSSDSIDDNSLNDLGVGSLDKDIMLNAARWGLYKEKFKKNYSSLEDQKKFKIFMINYDKINLHNKKYEKGSVPFSKKLSFFTDMKLSEAKANYTGFIINDKNKGKIVELTGEPPDSWDWRTKGAVTPVQNQGLCGSSWSFAATGALEGQHFLKTNKLISFSQQELIDCATSFNNFGCSGGNIVNAFSYFIDKKGANNDSIYPYEAREGKCRSLDSDRSAAIKDYECVPSGDENALMKAVVQKGPISSAIAINKKDFCSYSEGVYECQNCTQDLIHAVLIVGYGSTNGKKYWMVKNSWGTSWGDNGYIKMSRGSNQCGIASFACYPVF